MPSDLSTNGLAFPGFFRNSAEWQAESAVRFYRLHLEQASDTFDLTGVFCIAGKPTVYFTKVDAPDANREAEWQRLLWNQDTASMLVVEDPIATRIYSALAKPDNQPALIGDARLAESLGSAAFALELHQFLLSVQTGQFYRDHPESFRTETAVDQYLLANLTEARKQLVSKEHEDCLSPEMANAFLARCLFTTYLIERDVIGKAQLEEIDAPIAPTLLRVLETCTDSDGIKLLFRLFRLLDDDFNGSMFGGSFYAEQTKIRARHISVLRRLLRGDDLGTNQQVLFDLYDFHFIPIELISAIYENFLVGRSQDAMDGSESEQRMGGAYYTPPRLAELVVDIATEGWDTLLDKRYLDPACGSCVFLVILFQRMASEWCRRHPRASNVQRARKLREILTEKLCGIDVDPTACMVACFSLYLAFLDQLKPRDIWELKEALDAEGSEKVLPPLHCEPKSSQGRCPVILETNFFSQDADCVGQFDLVIGNPPWTGRNQPADPQAEAWLLGDEPQRNPYLKDGPSQKQARAAQFFPQKQSAIGYMWKVPQHVKTNGVACLLLPSRVILANTTDAFQAAWFRRFTIDAIWQLADYSFILFNEADCPAIVAKFGSGSPNPEHAEVAYFTPKVERIDPRHATILVTPDDCKTLNLVDLLAAANDDCAYMFWKMPFWGTDRDRRLLDRLRRLTSLELITGETGEGKRWTRGKGFQFLSEADKKKLAERISKPSRKAKENKPWWNSDAAFLPASGGWGLILDAKETEPFGEVPDRLRRLPDREVFSHPLVVVNDGFSRIAFVGFDVLFQHSLGSISGPKEDEDLLLFLTALLNTPLATYFLFHTSANWGIERDKVHFEELMQLPFPLPEETENPTASRRIVRQVAARLRKARKEMAFVDAVSIARRDASRASAIRDVTELVYRYFGLSTWERALVEDTEEIFEPSSTPTSLDSDIATLKPSSPDERKTYSELLCQTINRWARRANYFLVPSAVITAKEGLGLLTLAKKAKGEALQAYREQGATEQMRKLIERVAAASVDDKTGGLRYLRGFALFEEREVHILKPLSRHHWTRTAALNDADELASFIANMGQEA